MFITQINNQQPSLCLTSDLWCLVVHRDDGDIEEKAGDGAAVVVADREDELDEQRLRADVLYRGHEGHFHVVHCMLGEHRKLSLSTVFVSDHCLVNNICKNVL